MEDADIGMEKGIAIEAQDPKMNTELIRVEHLKKYFPVRGGVLKTIRAWVQAVDDVSFTIRKGETLGLVGEIRVRENQPSAEPCFA